MPKAEHDHTTRCGILGRTAAALLAGTATALAVRPAAAAPSVAAGDDAELPRLHMALVANLAVMDRIEAEGVGEEITPESEDQERRLSAANDQWWATAEEIIDTPALTAAGLRAKADATRIVLEHVVCTEIGTTIADIATGYRMAWSLARDLLAGSAAI